ncbi:MAG: phenylalanine--tRNA ligase subunit beta [Candidatus Saccharimonas sp.]|nr:MAG: phenylalanine--tRNA ligase subunit beta [Candidatus Saccharimonas sp.]
MAYNWDSMKVSLNIVKSLVNFELPPVDELVARVNAQLGSVEKVIDLGAQYKDARIVHVVQCEPHPNADRLHVCLIDDGGAVANIPRDDKGYVQVVCGAPNVHADMWAVWLPPNSTVPASFADAEPFVLGARKLRGVLSQGMLAAADELAIGTDHDGIVEISGRDMPKGAVLRAGDSFAQVFGLDDVVLDIENKMFTHRPDCFGQLGVAREISGIFGQAFTSPDWYRVAQKFADGSGLKLDVYNDIPDLVPRFMAVAVKNVAVQPSPLWLQCQLVAMGGKPINNIVDATNYIMLMTAQPTHAYDYDKLCGGKLGARMAREGETIALLNGKTYTLGTDDIVIADGERAVALGGIMGGADTEVSSDTNNVVLECASFDMYAVRKTAMRHGVFTDALSRFNKGQSPLQNAPVLKRLMGMIGGEQASEVHDKKQFSDEFDEYFAGKYTPANIDINSSFINQRLGLQLTDSDIYTLLNNVEVHNHGPEDELGYMCIQVPFWRTDIELKEDVVEEVGRLYDFGKLPRELPQRSTKPAPKNPRRELKRQIREQLSRAGANEALTYSFVHEHILKRAEQHADQAYRLSNALSPDLQYYRLSVLPSLLDKVHANIKAGHDEFCLFEIGKGHDVRLPHSEDGLPSEQTFVDAVYAAKKARASAPYYQVQRMAVRLLSSLGAQFELAPMATENDDGKELSGVEFEVAAPFDRQRSAWILCGKERLGIVGEFKQAVRRNFKLPEYAAGFSINFDRLLAQPRDEQAYRPLSRFPSTSRDVSLRAPRDVSYAELYHVVQAAVDESAGDITVTIEPRAIFQPANDRSIKTTTFRLCMTHYERTLTDADAKPIVDRVATMALAKLGAECV